MGYRRSFMYSYLAPDYYFEHYYDITADFLAEKNIECLLIDIDNTLAPYEQEEPDETTVEWFEMLKNANVKVALISNNNEERVTKFIAKIRVLAYFDAHKPSIEFYVSAMRQLKVPRCRTAVLGDQLLTDAWSGRRLGVRVIIVPPIKDKLTPLFRVKRAIEKPIMKRFFKKNNLALNNEEAGGEEE